jgi:NADPH:quinone reductase-like Zn-dependent oxidoreductase
MAQDAQATMQALTYRRYGPPQVVSLNTVAKPTPGDHEVLIRIEATTVTSGDMRGRSLKMPPGFGPFGRLAFGVFGPRRPILGTEFSGVVEAVGAGVTRFAPGDAVFAFTGAGFGGHAEYRVVPETGMILAKPDNLSFDEAAALSFGGLTALAFLRDKGAIRPGEKVLIVGASGGVGSAAIQIARHFGAQVTGVCSTGNRDLVASLGADRVIDYTREDYAAEGETYDLILDTTETAGFAKVAGVLAPEGRLVLVQASFAQTLGLGGPAKGSGQKMIAGYAQHRPADLAFLAGLAAMGEYRPFIDRRYRLDEGVAAHAYVDTGRKRGNVVLTMPSAGARR